MTITIKGPDDSTFNFPDDTTPDVISGFIRKHYGTEAGPKPSGDDVSAIAAAEGLPIIGAYAPKAAGYLRHLAQGGTTEEHTKQIKADIADYRQQHPIASTVGDLVVGSLPFGAAGAYAPAARALGMVGAARTAIPAAAASGALIGATDAAARGNDPRAGLVEGALTGAGGVLAGKAIGKVWDAARGMWVDRPRVPHEMDVAGTKVPVRESVVTTDPAERGRLSGEEQDLLGAQDPIAIKAEQDTRAGMRAAYDDIAARLDPTGQSPGSTAREAGDTAATDLIRKEQDRANAEVSRILGARTDTENLTRDLGGGIAGPAATQDVGTTIGQRIRDLATRARQATRTAYNFAGGIPAQLNIRSLMGVGQTVRDMVNALPDARISPEVTPRAHAVADALEREMQTAITNAAVRGNGVGPVDIEEVRKFMSQAAGAAWDATRAGGSRQDAMAVSALRDAFDQWYETLLGTPGAVISGDARAAQDAFRAARAAHAQERATFGRRGAADARGTFMQQVIGRFDDQQMSPEKIIKSILGTPGGAIPENAVPILNHLRDNVFGPNSQEWAAIKRSVISHLTEAAAGAEPLSLAKQVQNIERFMANERHAGAVFDAAEQTRIMQHADQLRAVMDEVPQRGTIEHLADQLAGRGGARPATGEEIISRLRGKGGGDLAVELQKRLPQETWGKIKQGLFRREIAPPEGATDWGSKKISDAVAKFLDTDLVQKAYTANDRLMMKAYGDAEKSLIPADRTTNPSGSGYVLKRAAKGMLKQTLKMMLGTAHGVPGYIAAEGMGRGIDKYGQMAATARSKDLFLGKRMPLPRQGGRVPPAVGAVIGQIPSFRPQVSDQ